MLRFFLLSLFLCGNAFGLNVSQVLKSDIRLYIPDTAIPDLKFSRAEALDLLIKEAKKNPSPEVYLKLVMLNYQQKESTISNEGKRKYWEIEADIIESLLKLSAKDEGYVKPLARLAFYSRNTPILKVFGESVKESPFFTTWYKVRLKGSNKSNHEFYSDMIKICKTKYECMLAYHQYLERVSWDRNDKKIFDIAKSIQAIEPDYLPAYLTIQLERLSKGEIGLEFFSENRKRVKELPTPSIKYYLREMEYRHFFNLSKAGDLVSALYFADELYKKYQNAYGYYTVGNYYMLANNTKVSLDYLQKSLYGKGFHAGLPYNILSSLNYLFMTGSYNKKKQLEFYEETIKKIINKPTKVMYEWEIFKIKKLLNPGFDGGVEATRIDKNFRAALSKGWKGTGVGQNYFQGFHYCHMLKYKPGVYEELMCSRYMHKSWSVSNGFRKYIKPFIPVSKVKNMQVLSEGDNVLLLKMIFADPTIAYASVGVLLLFLILYRVRASRKEKNKTRKGKKEGGNGKRTLVINNSSLKDNVFIRITCLIGFSLMGFAGVLMAGGFVENPLEAGEAIVYGVGKKAEVENWPPKEGQAYPELELYTHTGKEIKLSDLKGKYVLLELVGMTCKGCHAFTGGNKIGKPFHNIYPQQGLKSIHEYAKDFGGFDLANSDVIFLQVLAYDLEDKKAKKEDIKLWTDHFYKEGVGKNTIIAVPKKSLVSRDTYRMIPTFHLIDKSGKFRSRGKNQRLFTELLPLLGSLAEN